MKRRVLDRVATAVVLVTIGLGAWGCGGSGGPTQTNTGVVAPDFTLTDMNPASPTGGNPVSVRDLIGKVSAWYFGHAT